MSIVTRQGDKGETSLLFSKRVSKSHIRIEANGTIDELNASLGLLRGNQDSENTELKNTILDIQKRLIGLMGEIATDPIDREKYLKSKLPRIDEEDIQFLDLEVSKIESMGLTYDGWVIPGETRESSYADMARTICRKAERTVVHLIEEDVDLNGQICPFLNRLSDYLWLLGRVLEKKASTFES